MAIRVYVRKRKDRRNLVLYYDDPDTGREVWRSAGTPDKQEAARAAQRWEDELRAFRGTDNDGWAWFKQRFFDERYASLSPGTRQACRTALKRYAAVMNPTTITDVTADSLSMFASKLKDAPATIAKHLRHLKVCLRWAATIGMIAKAPHVELPKQGKRKFMRGRPITEAEYQRMLKHCDAATGKRNSPRWRRMLRLLWLSGLRIDEATALRWDGPPLYVDLAAQPYPCMVIYGEAQKSGDDESVPLAPDFVAWLQTAPESARKGLVAPLRGGTNKRLSSRVNISKAIARIGKAAKVKVSETKYASAHDLRRSFGTRWSLKVPPTVLQKMMRHATLQTTMRYYVHLDSSQVGAVLWQGVPAEMPALKRKNRKRPGG